MIGGGTRSSELIVPGLVHDDCSAFHPIAAASPCFADLDLVAESGLTWLQPTVDCAHPLDDGSAGAMYRSIEQTAEALGADGQRWRRLFEPMASRFEDLLADATQPILRLPRHPLTLARFGARSLLPATTLGRMWRTEHDQGALGRRRCARVRAAQPAHDQRRRTDADRGRTRPGLGGGQGWLAGHRHGIGNRHRTSRRPDRDRCARDGSRRPATERRGDVGRGAVDRRRHPGRSASRSHLTVLPSIPPRAGSVQGRLRHRGRRPMDGSGGPPRRHRPPRRQRRRGRCR